MVDYKKRCSYLESEILRLEKLIEMKDEARDDRAKLTFKFMEMGK